MKIGQYILCLITDNSKHLIKDKLYKITELIYLSKYAKKEYIYNLCIYVNVGNGWQSKLNKDQYQLID